MAKAKPVQIELLELLKRKFGESNVWDEWPANRDSEDNYNRELYCPIIDLIVGPKNIKCEGYENSGISEAIEINSDFISKLKSISFKVSPNFGYNFNPRFFLAIEIEASRNRKHHIGDIVNASILGSIGIVVTLDDESKSEIYDAFCRTIKYLDFAIENEKMRNNFADNVLIVRHDDFMRLLRESTTE